MGANLGANEGQWRVRCPAKRTQRHGSEMVEWECGSAEMAALNEAGVVGNRGRWTASVPTWPQPACRMRCGRS